LYQRALAIREAALGPLDPKVAETLNNMAALYRAQGRAEEADAHYRRALTIFEAALGVDNSEATAIAEDYAKMQSESERKAAPINSLFMTDREVEMIGAALLGSPEEEFAQPGMPLRDKVDAFAAARPLMSWLPGPVPAAVAAQSTTTTVAAPVVYGPPILYLTAIVYFNPQAWSIWLNGVRVTPDHQLPMVDVISVTREADELKLHRVNNQAPVMLQLRPNQTFIAVTGMTYEGMPTALMAGNGVSQ